MNRHQRTRLGLLLLVGVWSCGPGAEKDPHSQKPLTPDEFGQQLFAILKNEDYEGAKRYLWHEQDWAYVASLGQAASKEKREEMATKVWEKLQEGITLYHERYFKAGARTEGGDPIRTVEYVRFIPGRIIQPAPPNYTNYNDSYLVIKINGAREQRLELDHIQVINGVWHISEIK